MIAGMRERKLLLRTPDLYYISFLPYRSHLLLAFARWHEAHLSDSFGIQLGVPQHEQKCCSLNLNKHSMYSIVLFNWWFDRTSHPGHPVKSEVFFHHRLSRDVLVVASSCWRGCRESVARSLWCSFIHYEEVGCRVFSGALDIWFSSKEPLWCLCSRFAV